jgi:hypothetical protein
MEEWREGIKSELNNVRKEIGEGGEDAKEDKLNESEYNNDVLGLSSGDCGRMGKAVNDVEEWSKRCSSWTDRGGLCRRRL